VCSAFTSSQLVAAVSAWAAAFLLWDLSWAGSFVGDRIAGLLDALSIQPRYSGFAGGVVTLANVAYYLGLALVSLAAARFSFDLRRAADARARPDRRSRWPARPIRRPASWDGRRLKPGSRRSRRRRASRCAASFAAGSHSRRVLRARWRRRSLALAVALERPPLGPVRAGSHLERSLSRRPRRARLAELPRSSASSTASASIPARATRACCSRAWPRPGR
jgi:hypothetical protein